MSTSSKRTPVSVVVGTALVVCLLSIPYDPAFAQMGRKESGGFVGGAIIGGIIGSMVGGNAGAKIIGSVAGAAIGGFVGSRVGAELDKQDRAAMARATRAAFVSGKTQKFSNQRTGVRGTVEVVNTSRNASGDLCRTVAQEVDKHGNVVRESISACRGSGGWES